MKITVIGTGDVGLVVGTCLAELCSMVFCGDVDQKKMTCSISRRYINYCVQARMEKGSVGMKKFFQNKYRLGDAYLLTRKCITQKTKLTPEFLKRKTVDYETLCAGIERLKAELTVDSGLVR